MTQDLRPKGTVIFDGECGACLALKRRAEAFDTEDNLNFVSSHAATLSTISPSQSPYTTSQALCFVRQDGRNFQGARAVFEVMKQLPGFWGILGQAASLPGVSLLAEPFYRLFAHHRHTISRRLGLTIDEQ